MRMTIDRQHKLCFFERRTLHWTKKRGIISLIPQKEKYRLFLKVWQPITLLKCDYKIIAKVMPIRLQNVLPYIINEDQTGYIKGRFVGQNIRIIEDVVYFTETENLPGIILTIDFEKDFDSINWNVIDTALDYLILGQVLESGLK